MQATPTQTMPAQAVPTQVIWVERLISYVALTVAFAIMIPVLYFGPEAALQSEIPAAAVLLGVGALGLLTCIPRQVGGWFTAFDVVFGGGLTVFGLFSFYDIFTGGIRGASPAFTFTQAYAAVYFYVGLALIYQGLRPYLATRLARGR